MKDIPSMAWMVPDNSPSMEASPNMMWNPSLSEFFLNRICEQVDRGINLSRVFKECYLKSVCNDVKDFIGITVTPLLGVQPHQEVESEVDDGVQD
jgi:hypothetical protein